MMNLDTANITVQVLSLSSVLVTGVYGVWRRIDKRQQTLEICTQRLEDKIDRIEHQFGPNGGGLREAVNNMSNTVSRIDGRVTKIGDDVARLTGEFNQHMRENNN